MVNVIKDLYTLRVVKKYLEKKFGREVRIVSKLGHHFRTLKWKITIGEDDFVLKIYRNKFYSKNEISHIENALLLQEWLFNFGIPTVKPYQIEGRFVFSLNNNAHFMLMPYSNGIIIKEDEVNETQLYELGMVIGRMHKLLAILPCKSVYWTPSKKVLKSRVDLLKHKSKESTGKALEKIDAILRNKFELNSEIVGWTHWDIWSENILFLNNRVGAVLDFDRCKFAYPILDLARPALSYTINENKEFNYNLFLAFINGYQEYNKNYSVESVARGFRLLWYEMTPRWIGFPPKFYKELEWVTDHWRDLELILSSRR